MERNLSDYVSLDCEYSVTIPKEGLMHVEPTQVAITDIDGNILFNEYFIPEFKTLKPMSMARRRKIKELAKRKYIEAKPDILKFLKSKIIIGHDLNHDFKALGIDPNKDGINGIIDTARIPLFSIITKTSYTPRQLKDLVKQFLKQDIQIAMHNASEDAKATANLVRTHIDYLNSPGPITPESIENSKKILDYASRMEILTENIGKGAPKTEEISLLNHPSAKKANNYLKGMEGLLFPAPKTKSKFVFNTDAPEFKLQNNHHSSFKPASSSSIVSNYKGGTRKRRPALKSKSRINTLKN